MIYRAAVLGLGRIGYTMARDVRRPKPATHVEAWRAHPRTELVAVCDVAGVPFDGPEPYFADLLHLLADQRPDIVSVATPPETHEELVLACAEAGIRAVVCEKPLARSASGARRMVAACRKRGTLLWVNHSRHFDPALRLLRANCTRDLGEPTLLLGHYGAGLWNSGSHLLDLMRWFGGDLQVMEARRSVVSSPSGDLSVDARLTVGGTSALIFAHEQQDYAVFDLDLWGTGGLLRLTEFGYVLTHHPVVEALAFTGYRQLDPTGTVRAFQPRSFLLPMVEHVVSCLDGVCEPLSTGEDGLAVVEVLECIEGWAR